MADLVVVIGVFGFVAVCVAYVVGCDRIIGPDASEPATGDVDRGSVPSVPGTA